MPDHPEKMRSGEYTADIPTQGAVDAGTVWFRGATVAGILAFFFGAIWWAATLQSKVDLVLSNQLATASSAADVEKRVRDLEQARQVLELRVTALETKVKP